MTCEALNTTRAGTLVTPNLVMASLEIVTSLAAKKSIDLWSEADNDLYMGATTVAEVKSNEMGFFSDYLQDACQSRR